MEYLRQLQQAFGHLEVPVPAVDNVAMMNPMVLMVGCLRHLSVDGDVAGRLRPDVRAVGLLEWRGGGGSVEAAAGRGLRRRGLRWLWGRVRMGDTRLPALGAGLGFREPLLGELFLHRAQVDWLEIVTDHYLNATSEKARELELLEAHFPLIPHGLDLSLGSAEGLDDEYADQVAALINRLQPPWWSEHIAWTRAGGVRIGHLTPLPFTQEALNALCGNIASMQRRTDVPLILENISYTVALPGAEMTEAQFLTEVVGRTGCGLLLDITNLYANAVNHGGDPGFLLDALPLERVVQLHFVGGRWQDGVFVDSHSQPTPPEIWALMDEVLARAPVKGVLLERDDNLPPFLELAAELERARTLGRQRGRWD